jgi:hypothetical protein
MYQYPFFKDIAQVLTPHFHSDISIDRNDFDAGFLITFRKKSKFTLQKAMTFGQKITIIIITIIKHHNSKHYIYSIFIKTDDNRMCLL